MSKDIHKTSDLFKWVLISSIIFDFDTAWAKCENTFWPQLQNLFDTISSKFYNNNKQTTMIAITFL